MDWFPLYHSLRVAGISTAIIFFVGVFAAYGISRAPRLVKGALELIRRDGRKVIAGCGFVVDYLDRHPEDADLVA